MTDIDNNIDETFDDIDNDISIEEEPQVDKKEAKIVDLKRQNKELKKQLEELAIKQKIKKQYVDEGLDEDSAEKQSDLDVLKQELKIMKFERENRRFLSKYPDADLEKVMGIVSTGYIGIEQALKALYDGKGNQQEQRAKEAVLGSIAEDETDVVTEATRTSTAPSRTGLTKTERAAKQQLEAMLKKQMSDEDFKRAYYRT